MQMSEIIVQELLWLLLIAIGSHGLTREKWSKCDSNLCQNGGICNNITASPTCICPLPYIAPHCIVALDYCNYMQPDKGINELPVCLNGGLCRATYQEPYFNCSCAPQFSGSRCEFAPTAATTGQVTSSLSRDEGIFTVTQFSYPGYHSGEPISFLVKVLVIGTPSAVLAVAVIVTAICLCNRCRNRQRKEVKDDSDR